MTIPALLQRTFIFPKRSTVVSRGFGAIVARSNIATQRIQLCRPARKFSKPFDSTLLIDIEDCYRGTHARERECDATADAGSSARHHRDLAFEGQELSGSCRNVHAAMLRDGKGIERLLCRRQSQIHISSEWASVTMECKVAAGVVETPYSNSFRTNRWYALRSTYWQNSR